MKIPFRWRAGKSAKAIALACLVLAAATVVRAIDPPPLAQLRERTFDTYQLIRPRPAAELPVRVVDIDEASLAALGQWPWSRDVVAKLVERLTELGAAVIAFDVTFAEPDRTSPNRIARALPAGDDAARVSALISRLPDYDQVFADAIAKGPVVLGFAAAPRNDLRPAVKAGFALAGVQPSGPMMRFDGAANNLALFDQAASGIGSLNLSGRDKAGIVRRVPLIFSDGRKIYPSLVTEALRVAQRQKSIIVRGTGASGEVGGDGRQAVVDVRVGDFIIPVTDAGELWVYFNRDRPDLYVSAKDVLDPGRSDALKDKIEGNIVFVGTSAAGLLDTWPTPLDELVPGVSVHAQAVEQILARTFLRRPDWAPGAEILATLVLAALLTALLLRLGARFASVALISTLVIGLCGSWFAFTNFGLLLDPVYPLGSATLAYFAVLGVLYVASDREKKFVRQAFGQYVAPELLARLENAPEMMRLGGETRVITLMFMDVRDFTPLSEGLTAEQLVEFINRLLSPLTDTIQGELGTIDKYMGDAIMAFWNAPLDIPDHPRRACRAALEMLAVVRRLNEDDAFGFRARGAAARTIKIGIGINTGMACVGNMGSQRRFNYSAMGDVVNVTSRVEGSCKLVGHEIVISADTAEHVPDFAMLEAGDFALKGKSQLLKLFVLVGDERTAASDEFRELKTRHDRFLAALSAGNPEEVRLSLALCREAGGDALSQFYGRFEERAKDAAAQQRAAQAAAL